jgi:hypothetical protein
VQDVIVREGSTPAQARRCGANTLEDGKKEESSLVAREERGTWRAGELAQWGSARWEAEATHLGRAQEEQLAGDGCASVLFALDGADAVTVLQQEREQGPSRLGHNC